MAAQQTGTCNIQPTTLLMLDIAGQHSGKCFESSQTVPLHLLSMPRTAHSTSVIKIHVPSLWSLGVCTGLAYEL